MLYKGSCTRKAEVNAVELGEIWKAWSLFKEKMKPIRKWQPDEEENTKMKSDILVGMNRLVDSQNANIATMQESMKVKETKTAKLVKPAKVPVWTKEMLLAVYLKALDVWMETNKDISENVRFQDVIESLKMNKEVNGLAKYVEEHILPVLDTVEKQTVMEIVGILKRKYGRTRIEELEGLMTDWINFKANKYEDEDEYLLVMERFIAWKEEKKLKDKKWNSIWMMVET